MFTATVPQHLLYECTQYLNQNGQYINREYYQHVNDSHDLVFTFNSKDPYLAFCYRYSKVLR
jgi:hypothetical protein